MCQREKTQVESHKLWSKNVVLETKPAVSHWKKDQLGGWFGGPKNLRKSVYLNKLSWELANHRSGFKASSHWTMFWIYPKYSNINFGGALGSLAGLLHFFLPKRSHPETIHYRSIWAMSDSTSEVTPWLCLTTLGALQITRMYQVQTIVALEQ
jgi:hypothetical protein